MFHTSANLTFGEDEKIFGVQNSSRGVKKLVIKGRQKSGDLFFFFVGAPNGKHDLRRC